MSACFILIKAKDTTHDTKRNEEWRETKGKRRAFFSSLTLFLLFHFIPFFPFLPLSFLFIYNERNVMKRSVKWTERKKGTQNSCASWMKWKEQKWSKRKKHALRLFSFLLFIWFFILHSPLESRDTNSLRATTRRRHWRTCGEWKSEEERKACARSSLTLSFFFILHYSTLGITTRILY